MISYETQQRLKHSLQAQYSVSEEKQGRAFAMACDYADAVTDDRGVYVSVLKGFYADLMELLA